MLAPDDRVSRAKAMATAIGAGDLTGIAAALHDDFEVVVERMHPIVKEIKQSLLAFGARGALMSGSGPTVFGLCIGEVARCRASGVEGALSVVLRARLNLFAGERALNRAGKP